MPRKISFTHRQQDYRNKAYDKNRFAFKKGSGRIILEYGSENRHAFSNHRKGFPNHHPWLLSQPAKPRFGRRKNRNGKGGIHNRKGGEAFRTFHRRNTKLRKSRYYLFQTNRREQLQEILLSGYHLSGTCQNVSFFWFLSR